MHLFKRLTTILTCCCIALLVLIGLYAMRLRQLPALDESISGLLITVSAPANWQDVSARRETFARLISELKVLRLELRDNRGKILEKYPALYDRIQPNDALTMTLPVSLPNERGHLLLILPDQRSFHILGWCLGLLVLMLPVLGAGVVSIWRALAHERKVRLVAEQVLSGNRDPTVIDNSIDHVVITAFTRLLHEHQQLHQEQLRALDNVRHRSFVDPVTALGNRAYFDAHLEVHLRDRDANVAGVLMLIEIADVYADDGGKDNKERSDRDSKSGDKQAAYARVVGELLRVHCKSFNEPIMARRDEHSYGVLLPGMSAREIGAFARRLLRELAQHVERTDGDNKHAMAHIGAVAYQAGDDAYKLLSEADMALRYAQQIDTETGWYIFATGELNPAGIMGRVRWRSLLERVIEQRKLQFVYHPIVIGSDQRIAHYEVLSRVPSDDGELFTAATFLPMAHRTGLAVHLDRLVCDCVLKSLLFGPMQSPVLSINLSADAIADNGFRMWLLEHLAQNRPLAERLIFEIGEPIAAHVTAAETQFLESLKRCGSLLSVEHVGHPQYSAKYLQDGFYAFVKLHRSLTRDVQGDVAKQEFVRGLAAFVSSTGALILAEGIESEAQWQHLLSLGVKGGQGYWFGKPALKPQPVSSESEVVS